MNESKLTIKQQKFIEHYALTGNGAESARAAGYSENSGRNIACETLTKPYIKEAIEEKQQEYIEKVKLDNEFVLTRLMEIAKLYEEDAKYSSSSIKALELLGKYLKLWDSDIKLASKSHEEMLEQLR